MSREQSSGNGQGKVVAHFNFEGVAPERGFEPGQRYGLTFDALPAEVREGYMVEALHGKIVYQLNVRGAGNDGGRPEIYVDAGKVLSVVKFKESRAEGHVNPSSAVRLSSGDIPRDYHNTPFVAMVTSDRGTRYFGASAQFKGAKVIVQLGAERKFDECSARARLIE
jgi:hypothetical protein